MRSKKVMKEFLKPADIRVNGDRPWDIQVHNEKLYSRILAGGSLALGESYMDGWWDCEQLDEFFNKALGAELEKQVRSKGMLWNVLRATLTNMQNRTKAYEVGRKHYDIGNDLYEAMLDKTMSYSCGYWAAAKNLDQAQVAKLDLACRKLGLKKGMRVLDIGSGWGGFAKYAAENYGVEVVGVTISKEQVKLAKERGKGLPLEYRLQDYRQLNEQFDRIISIGMIEHVGKKNYRTYMEVAHRCLKPDGLFLLHTIGGNTSVRSAEPWINKYIFPNSMLPSAKQLTTATENLFVLEDWHSFGADYDKTLLAWHKNFTRSWKDLKGYDERFHRMWDYYLLACAGSFRARKNQLWQIVLSKEGVARGYKSIR